MGKTGDNTSITFFETQFRRQVRDNEYLLNPFEDLALDYLQGEVLDLGAGLGNLSLEAGRRGHRVLAVEASPTAVARINRDAGEAGLPVKAIQEDLGHWRIDRTYDTIVAIGLLMFFNRATALNLLYDIQSNIKFGGIAVINTLVEGTTYMEMFDPDNYHLFARAELEHLFDNWTILESVEHSFPAAANTVKVFTTLIARKM